MLSALDTHYDLGDPDGSAHPLVGRRMPDLDFDLDTAYGSTRVFDLLHDARPMLVRFGADHLPQVVSPWFDAMTTPPNHGHSPSSTSDHSDPATVANQEDVR